MSYSAEALKDQVISLPGQVAPLYSRQFSGFLQISSSKFIHYYYFESENDPQNDPIVFWTNGGPGCSGMLGLFTEMGPIRPIKDGKLDRNPHTWTRIASMVFLEQPAGVGFSYSTDESLLLDFNDYRASTDNVKIIRKFFEKFPERKQNPFYLASESYGGHYIPHWSYQIIAHEANADLLKQFKGYLVGNPFTSYASGSIAMANVLWGLQLIPKTAWDLYTASTCELLSHDAYFLSTYLPECFEYIDALFDFIASLNPCNVTITIVISQLMNLIDALEFPVCPEQVMFMKEGLDTTDWQKYPKWSAQTRLHLMNTRRLVKQLSIARLKRLGHDLSQPLHRPHYDRMKALLGEEMHEKYHHFTMEEQRHDLAFIPSNLDTINDTFVMPKRDPRALQYDPCSEYFAYEYLNLPEVQEALHVGISSSRGEYLQHSSSATNDPTSSRWAQCSDRVNGGWAFTDYLADTTSFYQQILQHPRKPLDFKMLVFSGDSDGVCATVGTQHWIYQVQPSSEIHSLYKPWYYFDSNYGYQAGGYLTQFSHFFSFATVHFAGHEVPAYQPEKAYQLFNQYLNGSLFAGYTEFKSGKSEDSSSSSSTSSTASSSSSHVVPVIIAVFLVLTAIGGLIVCLLPRNTSTSSKEREEAEEEVKRDIAAGKRRDSSSVTNPMME